MSDNRIGTLARLDYKTLAERAADVVMAAKGPRAVCLDPEGLVTVENPDHAVPDEILGTYDKRPGLLEVYRSIRDNLAAEIEARGGVAAILARRKEQRRAAA